MTVYKNKIYIILFCIFFINTKTFSDTKLLADGLSSCAGTYTFAQEIYRNANNDERVEMYQDLSSKY